VVVDGAGAPWLALQPTECQPPPTGHIDTASAAHPYDLVFVTGDAWITLAVVAAVLIILVRDLAPPMPTVVAGVVALLVTDVIDADVAFAGFGNPAPITVAALYVVAAAVERTGLLGPAVARLLGSGGSERRTLSRLAIPSAGASAVLNNTPIVAMVLPQVEAWADRHGRTASRLLMPLSFATILGGVITTLGTSTNLVVSGLVERGGGDPFDFFEVTSVGLPVAVVGVIVLILIAPRLLPERSGLRASLDSAEGRAFVVQMVVKGGGSLDARSVDQAGLRNLQGVFLVEIVRGDQRIAPVAPDTVLAGDDVLTFVGKIDLVIDLQRHAGLVSTEQQHLVAVDAGRHAFYEAVIGAASPLAGRTLAEVEFRGRYQAAVVAIHRAGQRVDAKLGQVKLRPGDTLLMLAGHDFRRRWGDRRDFLVVSRLGAPPPAATEKAVVAGAIVLAVSAAAALGVVPILEAALLGAGAVVATRILTFSEALDAVDLDVVLLIGAAFGIGAGIDASGLATEVADGLVGLFDGLGTRGVVLGVVLATIALTELITNNAAAVLMFPIAVAAGSSVGLDPRHMAVAVAVSASASFLTPIGYQTNTMVYGPGGYRFGDYFRLGLPLTVAVVAVIVAIVPTL